LAVLLVGLLVVVGCRSLPAAPEKGGKLLVYTSIYPLADFAGKIGGDHVTVTNLVSPGVEPHDFELSPRQLAEFGKANVFVYNGAGLERWADRALQTVDSDRVLVVNS
jgi:zinc transport system substrate-binding protein